MIGGQIRETRTFQTSIVIDGPIGHEAARFIVDELNNSTTLTSLTLRNNGIDNEVLVHIATALRINTTLVTLVLHLPLLPSQVYHTFDEIDERYDVGIGHLAEALPINGTLRSLDLSGISLNSAYRIATAMRINSTLTSLSFGSCMDRIIDHHLPIRIGDDECDAAFYQEHLKVNYIINQLRGHISLTRLFLGREYELITTFRVTPNPIGLPRPAAPLIMTTGIPAQPIMLPMPLPPALLPDSPPPPRLEEINPPVGAQPSPNPATIPLPIIPNTPEWKFLSER
ncbi:MAG: hypothetical protein ACHQUC_09790 [Chlamydiales bacterium]